jgi:hypothetical protein
MLEHVTAGQVLAASRNLFASNGEVGTVFGVALAEIGWNPQKPQRIGYGSVDFLVHGCDVCCGCEAANVCGDAVGDFALKVMVDGSAAAASPHNIYAQLLAGFKVNPVLSLLVSADAYRAGAPPVEAEGVGDFFGDSRLQDCFVDCHVHCGIVNG